MPKLHISTLKDGKIVQISEYVRYQKLQKLKKVIRTSRKNLRAYVKTIKYQNHKTNCLKLWIKHF